MVFGSSSSSPPSLFPLYLLPSLPFRRRSSTSTNATTLSTSPTSDDGGLTGASAASQHPSTSFLGGNESTLRCTKCLVDLCSTSQIISKGFTGRHGRAYLVSGSASTVYNLSTPFYPPSPPDSSYPSAMGTLPPPPPSLLNIHVHKPVPRQLVTGLHTVADISCAHCGAILGWKYVAAEEEAQRYKVGKFILETKKICRGVSWEHDGGVALGVTAAAEARNTVDEEILFDSQDEDECEDLFAGVWSPALAKKRRKSKGWM